MVARSASPPTILRAAVLVRHRVRVRDPVPDHSLDHGPDPARHAVNAVPVHGRDRAAVRHEVAAGAVRHMDHDRAAGPALDALLNHVHDRVHAHDPDRVRDRVQPVPVRRVRVRAVIRHDLDPELDRVRVRGRRAVPARRARDPVHRLVRNRIRASPETYDLSIVSF